MRIVVVTALAVAVGLALAATAAAPPPPAAPVSASTHVIEGTWRNERGSVLELGAPDAAGHFSGTFRSAVGNTDPTRALVLRGVANGDVVGFSVSFGAAGSVASWTGQVDGARLATLWHLARNVADDKEAADLWGSVVTGSDVFFRQ